MNLCCEVMRKCKEDVETEAARERDGLEGQSMAGVGQEKRTCVPVFWMLCGKSEKTICR